MDWLGEDFDKSKLDSVQAENTEGTAVLDSYAYDAVVEQAFIRKSDTGSTMFHIEGTAKKFDVKEHEPEKFLWMGCARSGDDKGNKATYTNKKGEEVLLPSVIQIKHFFDAIGQKMETAIPTDAKVEYRGEIIDAKVFKKLTGKKFTACIRQYENEYNGDISIRYDIENFLDIKGCNRDGEEMRNAFMEKIEKHPIKKLRKKAETNTKPDNAVAEQAKNSGW